METNAVTIQSDTILHEACAKNIKNVPSILKSYKGKENVLKKLKAIIKV